VLQASRRPWASFYANTTHYVVTTLAVTAERRWLRYSALGLNASASRATFSDPVDLPGDPAHGLVRRDRTLRAEAYANLAPLERLAFRVACRWQDRSSNDPDFRFDGLSVFGGVVWGWF
jgi:hypothetical protein